MKWLLALLAALSLSGCAGIDREEAEPGPKMTSAQVGVVNHTGSYIYSASIDGVGGGKMSAWSAGGANICCAPIPEVWYPGMKGIVRWNMPIGRQDVIKQKAVPIEKYDRPGSIYLHFFPNDEIRVIVTSIAGWSQKHPIPPPQSSPPTQTNHHAYRH